MTQPETPSRRKFFMLGALAAVGLKPASAGAQRAGVLRVPVGKAQFQTIQQRETPAAPATWRDKTTRLLRRTTYGPTQAELTQARSMGYQGWLNYQLKYTRIPDTAVKTAVAERYPLLSGTGEQLFTADVNTLITQLQQAAIYRATFSQRQLYERMVEFWSDHFNIYIRDVNYLKVIDERDVIRKHALGRFGDLVKASSRSAAMLAYLDQTQSRVGRPNENYARELMELHTLGVDGGYTQTDVSELARVLTGWTIRGRGEFNFDATGHDWTTKTVMGIVIPAGSPSLGQEGIKEGERIIDMLLAHPNTAKFISTKMIRWLLTSEPTDSQVATISGVYRSTGGDISAMVRAILNEAWVSAAPVRYKRPFHYLVSSMRALGVTGTSMDTVNRQLPTLGQALYSWETPDGYPDSVEWWAGGITPRWAFANTLANYNTTTIAVDPAPYMTAGVDGTITAIDQRVFGGEISPSTRTALRAYLAAGTYNTARVRETMGLAIAASDFQWY